MNNSATIIDSEDEAFLRALSSDITEKFGSEAMWGVLFLMMLMDKETWTLPDCIIDSVFPNIVEYIKNNEELKKFFQKERDGHNK